MVNVMGSTWFNVMGMTGADNVMGSKGVVMGCTEINILGSVGINTFLGSTY